MKRILHLFVLLGFGGVLLAGCQANKPRESSTFKPTAGHATRPGKGVTNSVILGNAEALARFAAAESYRESDRNEQAETQFLASVQADPSNEELAISLAREFIKDQMMDKAVAILAKPAARPEASSGVMIWYARALVFSGKTNQALTVCRQVLQRPVVSLDGYDFIIEIMAKTGQMAEASRALVRLGKDPKADADYLISLAELYSIYGQYQAGDHNAVAPQVVGMLDRAAKLSPTANDLLKRMADAYGRFGQPQKAALYYTKILASMNRPSGLRDTLREKLANIYLQTGDQTNAVKQLQAIVHDSPTGYPEAWFLLGSLAFDNQNMAEAGRDFEQAIIIEPNLEQAYYNLAQVQLDLQHTEEAMQTLEKAEHRFPKSFVSEFFHGLINSRLKKYAEAVQNFSLAETMARIKDSKRLNKEFYFQYAAACERNGDRKRAAELFQKCITLDGDFAEALNYLGFMWAERGENLVKARELIEKAVKLEPKNGAYLDSLGWVIFKLNQPAQALPWLLKAQEFTPEADPTLLDHLGDVYLALHQVDKARQAWEKSLTLETNPDVKKKLDLLPRGNS